MFQPLSFPTFAHLEVLIEDSLDARKVEVKVEVNVVEFIPEMV
jgi:hypothetical protein